MPYAGIDEARESFEQNADRKTRGQVSDATKQIKANEPEEIRDTGTKKKGDRIRKEVWALVEVIYSIPSYH
jgi:hypothetical protein